MKNTYKVGVLMLCIIILWNCQTSDQIHQNQESFNPNYKRTLIDLKTFANEFSTENSKYSQLMELFSPKGLTHFNSKQRASTAKIRNFILDKNAILKIQQEQKVTYTIPAKPDVDTGTFFNLVIATNAEGILLHGHLLEYKPSVKWLKNSNLPYTGKVRIVQQEISNLSTILNSGKLVLQRICPLVIRGSWTCSFGNNHAPGECNGSYFNFNLYMIPDCTQGGGETDNPTNTYTDIGNPLDTGGGSGGNSGGNTATTTPMIPSRNEKIINLLTDPCANGIFEMIKNEKNISTFDVNNHFGSKLKFSGEILALFNNSKHTDFIIKNSPLIGKNAITIASKGDITTILSNTYLKKATSLSIARTMIHELVHAYLENLYRNPITNNSLSFKEKMDKYAKDNNYIVNSNRFHHEFMGQYVNAMAVSLFLWDRNHNPRSQYHNYSYYYAMAFGGLFYENTNGQQVPTNSFKELVPNKSDRDKIIQILNNEQEGNDSAKGKKCN